MRRSSSWIKLNLRRRSRSGLRLLFAFLLLLLGLAPSALRAASFTATLDRETVTVGETATLSFTFKGGEPKSIPALPQFPNLQIDRKSTRLNSSHLGISYAVFCFKQHK